MHRVVLQGGLRDSVAQIDRFWFESRSLKLEPLLALACRIVVDLAALALICMILTSDLQQEAGISTQSELFVAPR